MEMKNVKDPVAYIEVQESTLYSKVNGILGLNKDSMKRKGYVSHFVKWFGVTFGHHKGWLCEWYI